MFSPTRVAKCGYVLGLAVAVALLVRPSVSEGQQFRGSMPPPPLRLPLSNQLTDSTGGFGLTSFAGGFGIQGGFGGGIQGFGGGFGGNFGGGFGGGGFAGKGFGGFNGKKAL
jgi:hypothetical protein